MLAVGAFAALLLAAGAAATSHRAAIQAIVVTTTTDVVAPGDGKISLREAIDQTNAAPGEVDIVLAGHQQYNLTLCQSGADDDANKTGDLDHFGAGLLTISGNGSTIRQTCASSRVLDQLGPALLNLTDMTIAGGHSAGTPGGGVFARGGGELQLKNDLITGNVSDAAGGGIAAFGPVTITGTTIYLNQSTELAGGIAAIGPMVLVRSVVSGNTAPLIGGVAASAGLKMAYSTVQDNSIPNVDVQQGGLTSFGSVVGIPRASAPGGGGAPGGGFGPPPTTSCNIAGGSTSLGYNFDNDGSCGFGGGKGDRSKGGDPMLRPMSSGGPNPLIVPQPGSPLIDAIPKADCNPGSSVAGWLPSWSPLGTDINGVPRPQGAGCDMGAVEVVKAVCLKVATSPRVLVHRRLGTIVAKAKAGAVVTVRGAGVAASKKADASGTARFAVRPKKAGSIVVSAGAAAGCRSTVTVK